VPETKVRKALTWLENNTHGASKKIKIDDSEFEIKTDFLYINETSVADAEIPDVKMPFESIRISLCIKFDLDSSIIKFWEGGYGWRRVPEKVDGYLLPHNQIWVGSFDTSINRIDKHKLYRFEFQAVTSDMSSMLRDSHSARTWLLNFSRECSSKVSLFDFEGEERFIYYEGKELKFETKSLLEESDKNLPQNLINDFYKYETELYPYYNFSPEEITAVHDRINIIEGDYYNIYLLGNKWYVEILSQHFESNINFRELSIEEIYQLRKEGKGYSDILCNNYYRLLQDYWRKNLLKKKELIDLGGDKMWYTKTRK
jgi:hypothetical protein